jgi:hypothetical protein
LPGSRSRDYFKPLNIPGGCDGLTLLAALGRMVANVPAAVWQAECAHGQPRFVCGLQGFASR